MPLNKVSPIPLYYQLAELIREQVHAGDLKPGDQIPPERVLSEQHAISRMTARQAIGYLVSESVLVVRHGLGTFVAEPKLTRDMVTLLGFTEEMIQRGTATSQVIAQHVTEASGSAAEHLALARGDAVTRLVRLRLLNGEPLLLETTLVPTALCPGLEYEDMTQQSLYSLLERRYNLRVSRSRQTLEAVVANEIEASYLTVESGAPMFLLESVTFAEDGQPVEFVKTVYRGDRFTFAFEAERAAPQPSRPQVAFGLRYAIDH